MELADDACGPVAAGDRGPVRNHLGGPAVREDWPADEILALDEVGAILDTLSELDDVEPAPPRTELPERPGRRTPATGGPPGGTGVGIHVVGIDRAIGLDADLVIVVGLAEGSLPTRAAVDPLSRTPADLGQTGLPTRHDHAARQHHAFLAALTAASERIVLVQPRGDLRRSGDRPMSRLSSPSSKRWPATVPN
ncbi:MAG: hypothetical protein Ct9H300mP31_16520 [Acidimicrobiaceae bacterium]|nr:MAG: hypothetical protein Ct9H300mP31_16520 [Acidimicrobiaceae bacterium]